MVTKLLNIELLETFNIELKVASPFNTHLFMIFKLLLIDTVLLNIVYDETVIAELIVDAFNIVLEETNNELIDTELFNIVLSNTFKEEFIETVLFNIATEDTFNNELIVIELLNIVFWIQLIDELIVIESLIIILFSLVLIIEFIDEYVINCVSLLDA